MKHTIADTSKFLKKAEHFLEKVQCGICYAGVKNNGFNCNHRVCKTCYYKMECCPFCRAPREHPTAGMVKQELSKFIARRNTVLHFTLASQQVHPLAAFDAVQRITFACHYFSEMQSNKHFKEYLTMMIAGVPVDKAHHIIMEKATKDSPSRSKIYETGEL